MAQRRDRARGSSQTPTAPSAEGRGGRRRSAATAASVRERAPRGRAARAGRSRPRRSGRRPRAARASIPIAIVQATRSPSSASQTARGGVAEERVVDLPERERPCRRAMHDQAADRRPRPPRSPARWTQPGAAPARPRRRRPAAGRPGSAGRSRSSVDLSCTKLERRDRDLAAEDRRLDVGYLLRDHSLGELRVRARRGPSRRARRRRSRLSSSVFGVRSASFVSIALTASVNAAFTGGVPSARDDDRLDERPRVDQLPGARVDDPVDDRLRDREPRPLIRRARSGRRSARLSG